MQSSPPSLRHGGARRSWRLGNHVSELRRQAPSESPSRSAGSADRLRRKQWSDGVRSGAVDSRGLCGMRAQVRARALFAQVRAVRRPDYESVAKASKVRILHLPHAVQGL